ncbi:Uncharacterized protein LSUE1_G005548 [Lachnellula suecica]|uniref:Uncharacterized protein n=1 Tax=Lachnellula suecica TaxID=602035 RepID=A0A8T9CC33_9HELO|nr:Uncharacterized protein LSUE1_G005548 [Lachnellula suecica]
MASPELSARLRFLNDSAHLLVASAPETSRHLMSKHNYLLFDSYIDISDAQRRKACVACGTIMIMGWNGTLETQRTRRKGKRREEASQPAKVMVYKCESCGNKTRHPLPGPPRAIRSKATYSKAVPPSSSTATSLSKEPPAPTQSPNSSSKKRAKSRKQGSLQAILAKQKAQETTGSGFGLDLMDFMKKG